MGVYVADRSMMQAAHRITLSNTSEDNSRLLKTPHLRPSIETSKQLSGTFHEREASDGFYQRYLMQCD